METHRRGHPSVLAVVHQQIILIHSFLHVLCCFHVTILVSQLIKVIQFAIDCSVLQWTDRKCIKYIDIIYENI